MSHERKGKSNEWYTPLYVFEALNVSFDLDVASPEIKIHSCVPANYFYSSDGLGKQWKGFVWMNPPFGNQKNKYLWINRFINHGNGIALMPDRSSAPWWQYLAENTDAILAVKGRIKFIDNNGDKGESPSNGTTLFAIGKKSVKALRNAEENGLGKYYFNTLKQTGK